jgi:ribosomal protein S18 acetylase RimI-like enzyme
VAIEIERYTAERIADALAFENELRKQEPYFTWDIGEKYQRDVKNSFESPQFDGSIKAYLDWICVLPSHRHSGTAQMLMQSLREALKERGVGTLIGLMAENDEAQRFYRAMENALIRDEGIWIDIV